MNKLLERDIKLKLLKFDNNPLTQEDFDKITELSINNHTLSDIPKKIEISELSTLQNIYNLTLQHFHLGENELQILGKLQNMGILQIVSCKIDTKNTYAMPALEDLIISTCEITDKLGIVVPKHITINGLNTSFDLLSMEGLEKAEDVRLTNIKKIHNSSALLNASNLKTLMLDGSKVDEKSVIESLKDRVLISQEDSFYTIR